jgi:GNAT superfamily N-acetyltransferase
LNGAVETFGEYLFIHDLCVDHDYRKQGIANKLLDAVSTAYKDTYIIAVQDSQEFWKQKGYTEASIETTWDYRSQYTSNALYMHTRANVLRSNH